VPLITVAEAVHGFAVGQTKIALGRPRSACICGFLSTQMTTAFSGGFRYSPTTSAAFGPNSGSVAMHRHRLAALGARRILRARDTRRPGGGRSARRSRIGRGLKPDVRCTTKPEFLCRLRRIGSAGDLVAALLL
jgi:hypothetical protein